MDSSENNASQTAFGIFAVGLDMKNLQSCGAGRKCQKKALAIRGKSNGELPA
jgi:hypothetical protein